MTFWREYLFRLSCRRARVDTDGSFQVVFVNNGASDEDLELELTYFDDGLNNTDLDSFGLTPHSTGDIYFLLYM